MSEEARVLSNEEKMAMMNKMTGNAPVKKEEPEKTTEKVAEEKKEEVPEKVEAVEKTEEKVEKEEFTFDISSFNKKFGKEFESDDAINTLFEKADGYDGLKTTHEDTLQKLAEYENLASQLDPMSYFASEDEYIRQQFLKNNDGKIGEDAMKSLSVLSPSRVKELSSEEAIKLDLMVNNGLTGEEADAYLLRKYDIEDFSSDDIETGTRAAIKVDAKNAKENLGKLYDGIKIPEKVDYESARTQLKESWAEPISEIVKGIDKIELDDGLTFVVDDKMKDGLSEQMLSYAMSKQLKPSEETGAAISGLVREQILINNIGKVVKSIKADLTESIKSELQKTYHNDKPFKSDAVSKEVSDDNDAKMRNLL